MAFETVKVQGADGQSQFVLVDTITGETYSIPIYKLSIGGTGSNDGTISATNPMPIESQTETDDVVTKAINIAGQKEDGKARLTFSTREGSLDVDSRELRGILNAIAKELKKINLHLESMTDLRLKNKDVE